MTARFQAQINLQSENNISQSLISRDTLIKNQLFQPLNQQENQKNQSLQSKIKLNTRLNSLDIYRGLTMFGMVIVDCGGQNMPWYLEHPDWIGFSPADLIFPSFMFIMGMAIPLAVTSNKPIDIKKVIRVIALFGVGILLNLMDSQFNFQTIRIMGVLQRLSICYGVILLIHCLTGYGIMQKRIFGFLAILQGYLIYISYMMSFNHPQIGCPSQKNLTKQCNFAAYFDSKILSKDHMLRYPNDPQGIFTTLSALVTTYIGYYYCLIMKDNKNDIKKTLKYWFMFAFILGLSVYPLTKMMPLSKRFYSASFAILTSCVSGGSILLMVILVDIFPKRNIKAQKITNFITAPLLWLGRNPLFVYVLMQMIQLVMNTYMRFGENNKKAWDIFQQVCFQSWLGQTQGASVAFSCFFLLLLTFISWILYRKNIFIRL